MWTFCRWGQSLAALEDCHLAGSCNGAWQQARLASRPSACRASFMPLPPPPSLALTSRGKPIFCPSLRRLHSSSVWVNMTSPVFDSYQEQISSCRVQSHIIRELTGTAC